MRRIVAQHADKVDELKIVMLPISKADYSAFRGQILNYRGKPAAGVNLRLIV